MVTFIKRLTRKITGYKINLETNLYLSAEELCDRAWGKKNKDNSRDLELVAERALIRFIPEKVISTAIELSKKDLQKALEYIENSFYIYRGSVCSEWFALHYKTNEYFEWPSPAKFSWSDVDAIIDIGGCVNKGPVIKNNSVVEITSPSQDDKLKVTEIDVTGEKAKRIEYEREVIAGIDQLNKTLKYHIPDMRNVGFLNQQSWQIDSLRGYSNPIYWLLEHFLDGKLSEGEVRDQFLKNMEVTGKGYLRTFGVYRRHSKEECDGGPILFS